MRYPRFLGDDLPAVDYREARVVLIPAPLEVTVSYGQGTRLAPGEILRASGYVELYDEELGSEICRCGIHTLEGPSNELSHREFLAELEGRVGRALADGKFLIVVGGEHSLTIAPVRALKRSNTGPFTVLHMDAHADLRDEYAQDPLSHACTMRRVHEEGVPHVTVGLRSLSAEEADLISSSGLKVHYAADIRRDPLWTSKVVDRLDRDVYITIDVDVFDPSVISQTGTPEPGGLDWYQVLDLLRAVRDNGTRVLGMDLVEFSPDRGHRAESFTCARLIYKAIGYFA